MKEDHTWKMVWIGLLIICQMRRRRRAFILDQESFFCWTRFPICNPGHYQWIENTLLRDGIITNTLITMWYPHHMALSIPVTKILNKLWYMCCESERDHISHEWKSRNQKSSKSESVPLSCGRIVLFTPLFLSRMCGIIPSSVFSSVNSPECRHRSTAGHLILTLGGFCWPWRGDKRIRPK